MENIFNPVWRRPSLIFLTTSIECSAEGMNVRRQQLFVKALNAICFSV